MTRRWWASRTREGTARDFPSYAAAVGSRRRRSWELISRSPTPAARNCTAAADATRAACGRSSLTALSHCAPEAVSTTGKSDQAAALLGPHRRVAARGLGRCSSRFLRWWALGRTSMPLARAHVANASAEPGRHRTGDNEERWAEGPERLFNGHPGDVRERKADHWKISVVQSPPWRRTSWARAGPPGRSWKSTKKSGSTSMPPSGEHLTRSSHERSPG
jgi:hypothetical protein